MSAPGPTELLKICELAERAGVPVATVRHYLREGLLPEPVKTSRNMAYYPPEFVERIRLIKQLQEERFMPLRVIRDLLERARREPERLRAMIELEDRILDRALAGERERVPAAEVAAALRGPAGGARPTRRARRADARRSAATRRPTSASSRRSGAFAPAATTSASASPSTTPCATSAPSSPLVAEEVEVLTERLAGDVDPERAIEIIEAGVGPLNELMGALHTKLMVAALEHSGDAEPG